MLFSGLGAVTKSLSGLVEAVVAEGVAPLAVMQALRGGQVLVDGEAPDMLNMRIDEGGEAFVAVQATNAATRRRVGCTAEGLPNSG